MGLKTRVCGKYTVPIFINLCRLIQREWPFEKPANQVISFFYITKKSFNKTKY